MVAAPLIHRRPEHHFDEPLDGPFVIYRACDRHWVIVIEYVNGRNLAPYVQQIPAGFGKWIRVGFIQDCPTFLQRPQTELRRVALDRIDLRTRIQEGGVAILVAVVGARIAVAPESNPVELWTQVLCCKVAFTFANFFSREVPRPYVLNTTELHQGNPQNRMISGTRALAVGEDRSDASHRGIILKNCIQATWAVCPPVMSTYDLAFAVQNSLRPRRDMSDVGDLSRHLRRQSLHESDHHAGTQFQSVRP